MTPEKYLLKFQHSLEIRVQSVVLPYNHNPYVLKTEAQVLDWLRNNIHSQHSAFYQLNKKHSLNAEQVNWNNNKMQNQRYLETTHR
jgi:hypothetical protein